MSYHGKVKPGGPPDVRELADLIDHQVRGRRHVGNNIYLLRCRHTDEQVLVDAADDAGPDPRSSSAPTGSPRWSPPTSTGTTTGRSPRWSRPRGAETYAGSRGRRRASR